MSINIFNTNKFVKEEEKQGEIPKFSKISKAVLKIILPSIIETILISFMVMADGIMVSVLGNEANAAVTITKQPIFFMVCFITALNIAVTAIIARRKGEQNYENANKTMHSGIVISFILAIVLSILVSSFARPFCYLMGAQEDTIELATTYLSITAIGFTFNAIRLTINAAQRGIGNTKMSMYTNIIANLINICLNYCLISGKLGFKAYGISGAAYATIIGNFVAFLISFGGIIFTKNFLKFNPKFLLFDKKTFKNIFDVFPSSMAEQVFLRIGFTLFAVIVNNLGTELTYVHGVCNDVNNMLFAVADGFAIGTAAIVGHRLGEKRKDLAVVYAKVCMYISVMFCIAFSILMLIIRGPIISLYHPANEDITKTISKVLILAAFMAIPQNIQWVLTGILRGSGDTKYTAVNSMLSVMLIRPVLTYVLCYMTPLLLYGAWIGMILDQLIRCSANIWRFHSRKWLEKVV